MTAARAPQLQSLRRLPGRFVPADVWIAWHACCAVTIPLALSELRLQTPLWDMSFQMRIFLASLVIGHVAAAALQGWLVRRGLDGAPPVLAAVAFPYLALAAALEYSGIGYSRSVLLMAAGASFVLSWLSLDLMPRLYMVLLPALMVAGAGLGQVAFAGWAADDGVRQTAFYPVRFVQTRLEAPSQVRGGAIETLGDGFLVAAGDGTLYYADLANGQDGGVRRLRYELPLDRSAYLADRPDNTFGNDPFRVTDLLVEESGDDVRLFVSHHAWHPGERCVGLRVSTAEAPRRSLLDETAVLAWRTIYDSQPCLPLVELRFEQSGGSLARVDARTLLLSVGDHNLDGFYARASVPQDPAQHYGKTVRIDLESGAASVFTLGHRNGQGLLRTADGRLWLTEQGPAGGDELNVLTAGADYGWPLVTYGTAYDKRTWPPSPAEGRHPGFVEPVFAWVPSIAVTSILSAQRDMFPLWRDDLIVVSLKGDVIRLRVGRDDRVIFAEPIYATNTRIRDAVEGQDGRLVLYQDDGAINFIERVHVPADASEEDGAPPARGEVLYRMCQDCHRLGSGSDHGAGPDLAGLLRRDIASAPGFAYSPALAGAGGAWTAERLDRFLADPGAFAPGTTMTTEGLRDEAARRALIEYLAAH